MESNKIFGILFFLLLSQSGVWAQTATQCKERNSAMKMDKFNPNFLYDSRTDSIDILYQQINLDILDFTNKTIAGNCLTKFTPKVNGISTIRFDLMAFVIDSVTMNGAALSYSYNDTVLKCMLPQSLNVLDTVSTTIYYHGNPVMGTGSFGGFYWVSGIAFNLGVSLNDVPHSFGRAWFPCFDSFTERALYDCNIRVSDQHKAVCGGLLNNVQNNGDSTLTYSWSLHQPMVSYLVSVAVGKYEFVDQMYQSVFGPNIPMRLAALAADTTNMKNSFVNLNAAMNTYENQYGPYLWDRIGYVLVPFNSGAMEHATNISYPKILCNGSTIYETTMAHELSHHWWGDLVTCESAEDMWINEGSAVFSEYLFSEFVYNKAKYMADLRSNHQSVLENAHISDGDYWPISGIPQQYTYGATTYQKGANVIHSLRGYMDDAPFFAGLQAIQTQYKFKNINAFQYRDLMNSSSGQNLNDFFDDWVMKPGFTELNIDSVGILNGTPGNYIAIVYTKQKLRACPSYYNNIPVSVTFVKDDWTEVTQTIQHSGLTSMNSVNLNFMPVAVILNKDEKLAYAVTANNVVVKATGGVNYTYSKIRLVTETVQDSAFVRTEMHWVTPDGPAPGVFTISPGRFWKLDVIQKPGTKINAQFSYDGAGNALSFETGIIQSEDSVVILYRPHAGIEWTQWTDFTLVKGQATDKRGNITANGIISGEYAIGSRGYNVGFAQNKVSENKIKVYPNPSTGRFRIEFQEQKELSTVVRVYDLNGKLAKQLNFYNQQPAEIDLSELPSGIYTASFTQEGKIIGNVKLVLKK